MTHPANVIYLPPGVVPPAPAVAPGAARPGSPNIPFDRPFFEQILPGAVKAFCEQADCGSPIVELHTIDGTKHFIRGISGVTDNWVALHTQNEAHDHAVQVFLPFTTIYRVEIHPEEDAKQRRLGFIRPSDKEKVVQAPVEPPAIEAPAQSEDVATPGEPTEQEPE